MKKRKLTRAETISVASMLFGLFFGAGNLIFPAYMGQAAGRNVLPTPVRAFLRLDPYRPCTPGSCPCTTWVWAGCCPPPRRFSWHCWYRNGQNRQK